MTTSFVCMPCVSNRPPRGSGRKEKCFISIHFISLTRCRDTESKAILKRSQLETFALLVVLSFGNLGELFQLCETAFHFVFGLFVLFSSTLVVDCECGRSADTL